jgi:hypothetical protein
MSTYKEGSFYTLSVDYYHKITLQCTYNYDGFSYFIDNKEINYKENSKTKKLYKFNSQYQTWDTIENTIKKLAEDENSFRHLFHMPVEFRGD